MQDFMTFGELNDSIRRGMRVAEEIRSNTEHESIFRFDEAIYACHERRGFKSAVMMAMNGATSEVSYSDAEAHVFQLVRNRKRHTPAYAL